MKIKPRVLVTIISVLFLHAIACAREAPVEAPQISPAPVGNGKPAPQSETSPEVLGLAGFPVGLLKYEPALAAAFQLTPEQAETLRLAREESLGQTKKDLADNPDKEQVKKLMKRAERDFLSRRDAILNEEQMSLIAMLNEANASANKQLKGSKSGTHGSIKDLFIAKIRTSLSPDQLARIAAAGGKLP